MTTRPQSSRPNHPRAGWRTVATGDVAVTHHVSGSGPPLVLLHGLGGSATDWRWVAPALARDHRVHALDLPGLGSTATVLRDYAPAHLATLVLDFCDAVGIERAAFVGNSLGGLVALNIALAARERVSALGLLAAAGLGRDVTMALRVPTAPGAGEAMAAWSATGVGALQRATGRAALLFGNPLNAPRAWLTEQYRLARQADFLTANLAALRAQVTMTGQRTVLRNRLGAMPVPTLVLWGTRDRVLPPRHGRHAAARLPAGRLHPLAGIGHVPHIEAPGQVSAALAGFLAEHAAAEVAVDQ